jgi:uncharacterized SAM-binding protein YcdF (DUF218 family)
MRRQGQILLGPPLRRKGLKITALVFLLPLAVAGFPHLLARTLPVAAGTTADAILVLTGGEYRIQEGYIAWKEGKGKELYILGTGGGSRAERILPGRPALSPEELRRIHVEDWSENTLENAYSAKGVVSERKFERVILVTSRYHLPRAYLTLRTVLPPGVSISVIPVRSEWRDWGALARTLRRYVVEGWKYWWYRVFLYWE